MTSISIFVIFIHRCTLIQILLGKGEVVMKRLILVYLCIVLSLILLVSCSNVTKSSKEHKAKISNEITTEENYKKNKDIEIRKPYKTIGELRRIKVPIWYYDDIEAVKILKKCDKNLGLSISKKTVYGESLYYKKAILIDVSILYKTKLKDTKRNLLSDLRQPVYYIFEDFTTYFVYGVTPMQPKLGISGAGTSENEKIVAEARLVRSLGEGIEIEEFHYNYNEKLIFKCKSQFNKYGLKISETEKIGKKIKDYYFLWPIAPK